jgi:hypothetical protein
MPNSKLKITAVVLVMFTLGALSFAQSAATITGRVADPQGAVVPNATITATNTATGLVRTVTTTGSGLFRIPNLQPGTYDVSANATGFGKATSKAVLLQLGEQRDLNFNLGIAAASTSVEVNTEAPVLETTKTEVSTNVSARSIIDLPVTTSGGGAGGGANDYAGLALTAPGVKYDTSSVSGDLIGPGSINNRYNLYNVDGGTINDAVDSGRVASGASVDEIQELQIVTNNYNAEYGQAGGLILNAITKSGSNSVHGEGHIYFRGRNLTASQPFYNIGLFQNPPASCPNQSGGVLTSVDGCPRAAFHRQEGGFTLGGPVIKDRTFWFVSYEKTNQGFPLILTPPSGSISVGQPTKELQWSAKLDHRLSKNNLFTARFNNDRFLQDNVIVQTSNNITADSLTSQVSHVTGLNFGLVSTITPNLINEARYFRNQQLTATPDKTTLPGQQHAGFYTGANFCCPQGGTSTRSQYIDNLTWTHGSHSVKTGFNITYYPWFSLFSQFFLGQYSKFTAAGAPTVFTIGVGPVSGCCMNTSKDNIYGFYVQDSWKVRHNLTLNYGIRWDYEAGAFKGGTIKTPNGGCVQANGIIPSCSSDPNNFQPRFGFSYSPDWGHWIFGGPGKSIIHGSFAENTVLAYNNVALDSLNFDGINLKTAQIDGSTPEGAAVLAQFPNNPTQASLASFATNPAGPFGRVRPIGANLRNPEMRGVNFGWERQFGPTFVMEAQYIGQFGFGLFGENDTNFPAVIADPAHPGYFYFGDRPDPRFTAVRTNQNSRKSNYHGLVVSANKRMANHLAFQASYTWSKARTNGEDFFGLSEPALPGNFAAEMGPAFNDLRHAVNVGATIDTAKWTGNRFMGWFSNDIIMGFVGQFQSGRPYPVSTGTAGFANAQFFGAGNESQQRPNVLASGVLNASNLASSDGTNLSVSQNGVTACVAAGQPAASCAAIQNTFLAPASASALGAVDSITGDIVDFKELSGNVGRDAGRGLAFNRLDVSLMKAFHVVPNHERMRLELKADFFNIFNHSNFQSNISNDATSVLTVPSVSSPTFFNCTSCINPLTGNYIGAGGQILTLANMQSGRVSSDLTNPVFGGLGDPAITDIPRTIQLAVRFRF